MDQYVPASGFVNSGVTQSASRTYSTNGQKTIGVIAQNDQGAISSSATYTFSCNSNACPIGYILQGTACVFSGLPLRLQAGRHAVRRKQRVHHSQLLPGQGHPRRLHRQSTPDMRIELLLRTLPGHSRTQCLHLRRPSLVHTGQTSSISWTSENVESCTVKSNNQDNWTGLSSPGTISNPITSQTTFTLRCKALEGATPGTIQKSVPVNIAPTWQEPR